MRRGLLRACAVLCALALGAGAAEESVDLLEVDHRLYELGYRDGACSGVLDDVMINALRNFQRANGLGITGEPDAGTVLVLNSESAVSQADYLSRLAGENAAQPALGPESSGEEVVQLQRALKELGYFDGAADGRYGDSTAEAVRRFQLANGLPVSGSADSAVLLRLYGEGSVAWESFLRNSVAAVGDQGEPVRALQQWLGRKGYFEGEPTGRYGEGTQRAVRRFQTDAGLEVTGDANLATCRALFGNVTALMADANALRRGDAGATQLCEGLSALGYDAHEGFDYQTELALMQFQWANGLPVTGVADAAAMKRLGEPDAVGRAGFVGSGAPAEVEDFGAQLAHEAAQLLGRVTDFNEGFGLAQYVYMKCGAAVLGREQLAPVYLEVGEAWPGDVVILEIEGVQLCGVTASDGALIYQDASGRVVMGYPEVMGASSVRMYRLTAQ